MPTQAASRSVPPAFPACVPRLRPLLRPRPQTGDARPHAALAGPRPALSHALRSDA